MTRRGGRVHTLLSPRSVGSTSGFLGVAHLDAGDVVTEHYHPYSEEFLYVAEGTLEVQIDGEAHVLAAGQALLVPTNIKHRLVNRSDAPVHAVFQLGPLAPRPELGHVDTERGPGDDLDPPTPPPTASSPTRTPTPPGPSALTTALTATDRLARARVRPVVQRVPERREQETLSPLCRALIYVGMGWGMPYPGIDMNALDLTWWPPPSDRPSRWKRLRRRASTPAPEAEAEVPR